MSRQHEHRQESPRDGFLTMRGRHRPPAEGCPERAGGPRAGDRDVSPGPGRAGRAGRQGHARDDQAGRVDRRPRAHRRGARERRPASVQQSLESFEALRKVDVGYDVPPALAFVPAPGLRPAERRPAQPGRARSSRTPRAARLGRGAGLPAGHRAVGPGPHAAGQLDRADEALPRPAQAVRPAPEVRRHADRGPRPEAGRAGRRRDRRRAATAGRCTASPGGPRT